MQNVLDRLQYAADALYVRHFFDVVIGFKAFKTIPEVEDGDQLFGRRIAASLQGDDLGERLDGLEDESEGSREGG